MFLGYLIYDRAGRLLLASPELRERLSEAGGPSAPATAAEALGAFFANPESLLFRPGRTRRKSASGSKGESPERLELSVEAFRAGGAELFAASLRGEGRHGPSSSPLSPLAEASHELRLHLNGIFGYAQLLAKTGLNEEQAQLLDKLQASRSLLTGLVDEILEPAPSEGERAAEPVALGALASEIEAIFSGQLREKGLAFRCELGPLAEETVALPKLRVMQALSNLLSNAIKYTSEGFVRFCAAFAGRGRDRRLVFEVEDSGPGIASEEEAMLFEPYRQGDTSQARNGEGSGLGLAITKRLAFRLGGDLAYRPSTSGGSVFAFSLPAPENAPAAAATAADSPSPASEGRAVGRQPVLVVEDNELNAEILTRFLAELGLERDLAVDGNQAFEMYEDGKYSLILMDVMLPEMNGFEVTGRLLGQASDPPPIVGVTARALDDDIRQCLEAGMEDVVRKPIDFGILKATLKRYLPIRESSRKTAPGRRPAGAPPAAGDVCRTWRAPVESYLDWIAGSEQAARRAALEAALASLDGQIDQLEAAANRGDLREAERLAHSLKGSASLAGASDLSDLAGAIERAAAGGGKGFRASHWIALARDLLRAFESRCREAGMLP